MADEWFFEWQERDGEGFAVEGVRRALAKAGLTFSDLDYIVLHQAQYLLQEAWKDGGAKVGLRREQWVDTWDKYGNLGAVDVPANLVELEEEGKLKKGAIIALFAPGCGGCTPAMVIRWLA